MHHAQEDTVSRTEPVLNFPPYLKESKTMLIYHTSLDTDAPLSTRLHGVTKVSIMKFKTLEILVVHQP